jgi:hypothetical protein
MYIAGRLRTASNPSSTVICDSSYASPLLGARSWGVLPLDALLLDALLLDALLLDALLLDALLLDALLLDALLLDALLLDAAVGCAAVGCAAVGCVTVLHLAVRDRCRFAVFGWVVVHRDGFVGHGLSHGQWSLEIPNAIRARIAISSPVLKGDPRALGMIGVQPIHHAEFDAFHLAGAEHLGQRPLQSGLP